MLKTVIASASVLAFLAGAGMAMAETHDQPTHGRDYRDAVDNQKACAAMMKRFDAAKTTNAAAIAKRKKAENDCNTTSDVNETEIGVLEMKQALRAVGINPDKM